MDNTQPKKKKSVGKIIVDVLIWIFLVFAVLTTVYAFILNLGDGLPNINGTVFMAVKSPSMEPTIMTGDMIFTKLVKGDEEIYKFQEGDVVSYWAYNADGSKYINTHRIVTVNKNASGATVSYLTKGDNNAIADNYTLQPTDILCYWDAFGYKGGKVGGIGAALNFLNTQLGFGVCVVLPLVAFFIYELVLFIMTVMSLKNKNKKVISTADEELIKQRAIEEYLRQQAAANQAATPTEELEKTTDLPVAESTEAPAEETPADTIEVPVENVTPAEEAKAEEAEEVVEETPAEEVVEETAKEAETTADEVEDDTTKEKAAE
ncbi:MAG: signal peptidase I [Clostridia bacterium]|nr:signal peptidase I [Clostridia bacterium]